MIVDHKAVLMWCWNSRSEVGYDSRSQGGIDVVLE